MPGRTLFVGDSHSAGYWAHKIDESNFGSDNCYGRIYSQEIAPCVVYADPGAPNSVYPRWISSMFKKYIDSNTNNTLGSMENGSFKRTWIYPTI